MTKNLLYKLFGLRKLPEATPDRLRNEGIVMAQAVRKAIEIFEILATHRVEAASVAKQPSRKLFNRR